MRNDAKTSLSYAQLFAVKSVNCGWQETCECGIYTEHNPCSEGDGRSAGQESRHLLQTPKIHYRTTSFPKINFNIIPQHKRIPSDGTYMQLAYYKKGTQKITFRRGLVRN